MASGNNVASLFMEIDSKQVKSATGDLKKLNKESKSTETQQKKTASSTDNLTSSMKLLAVAAIAIKAVGLAKEVALMAARFETLGVVMEVVGRNTGFSATQMEAFAVGLQQTGISLIESRQSVTRMAQAQLDLAQSSDLARVAQNAAVIGNINSSEAFQRLVVGIKSAQTEILRNIGINVSFEQSYKKVAAATNRLVTDLTEAEKTQIRMDAVLKEGANIAGVYEAAMDTAGKKVSSLDRLHEDLGVQIGKTFGSATIVLVDAYTNALKGALGIMEAINTEDNALEGQRLQILRVIEATEQQIKVQERNAKVGQNIPALEFAKETLRLAKENLAVVESDLALVRNSEGLRASSAANRLAEIAAQNELEAKLKEERKQSAKDAKVHAKEARQQADLEVRAKKAVKKQELENTKAYKNQLAERRNALRTFAEDSAAMEEERLRASTKASDGMTRAIQDYQKNAEDAATQIEQVTTKSFKGMEDALVNFVKTGKLDFSDLANSIISDMIRIAIQQSITGVLAGALSSGISSLFSSGSTAGAGSSGTGYRVQAKGGVWSGGVQKFAQGGVVSSPTTFGMQGGTGLMGEAGPEVIAPLKRAKNGDMGISAEGLVGSTVNVFVENAPEGTTTQSSPNASGGDDITVIIGGIVDDNLTAGRHDKTMSRVFGAERQGF